MKKLSYIFLFLFVLLSSSLVAAQPPFQEFVGDQGLIIEFQKFEYLEVGEPFTVHAHAFNASNGAFMDNTTTRCFFHGYYKNGSHAIQTEMSFDPPFDWEFFIPGDFFVGGKGAWIIQCNSTDGGGIGGFVSGSVFITGNGFELMDGESRFYFMIVFAVLLLFGMFLTIGILTPYQNKREMTDRGEAIVGINLGKYLKLFALWGAFGFFLWFITIISGMADNYLFFEGIKSMLGNLKVWLLRLGKVVNWGMALFMVIIVWKDILLNERIKKFGKVLISEL